MHHLLSLGFGPFQQAFFSSSSSADGLQRHAARVVAAVGEALWVAGLDGSDEAQPASMPGSARFAIDAPTVGDWVAVERHADRWVVAEVAPRRSSFVRRAAGRRTRPQLVAANVDRVLVVTAVGPDLSARRIERYLAAVASGGALAAVVVNKSDRPHDRDAITAELGPSCAGSPLLFASSLEVDGLGELEPFLRPQTTVAFVGSSGVGKTSLIARLLGDASMTTAPVRQSDDTGRHATTRRELRLAPSGVLVLDTPGMRELGLWQAQDGIAEVFADVEELAAGCRFGDCGHRREPDCAVRNAVERGALPEERLASYLQLQAEMLQTQQRADQAVAPDTKKRWKQVSKDVRRRRKLHGRLGLKDQ